MFSSAEPVCARPRFFGSDTSNAGCFLKDFPAVLCAPRNHFSDAPLPYDGIAVPPETLSINSSLTSRRRTSVPLMRYSLSPDGKACG
jgi:hypothetical protein